jgi:hypothetical protein
MRWEVDVKGGLKLMKICDWKSKLKVGMNGNGSLSGLKLTELQRRKTKKKIRRHEEINYFFCHHRILGFTFCSVNLHKAIDILTLFLGVFRKFAKNDY